MSYNSKHAGKANCFYKEVNFRMATLICIFLRGNYRLHPESILYQVPLTVLWREALMLATTQPEKYYNSMEPDRTCFKAHVFPETITTGCLATCQPNNDDSLNPFTPAAQAHLLSSFTPRAPMKAQQGGCTAGLGSLLVTREGRDHEPQRARYTPIIPVDECFSNYCLILSDCTNAASLYIPPTKITSFF